MDKKTSKNIIKAKDTIQRNGGKFRGKKFEMPEPAGLKLWAARDCLVNYGKFQQVLEL